jgi:hypothetical protein
MYRASATPAEEREKTAGETPASFPSAASFSPSGSATVSAQEKRAALGEVLGSERFSRAEQLRNFLRYICEMDLAGRGGELCEALIGVEALGRPADYTPTEDASVRRRASDLREKLQDVYSTELAGSRVRIELPKGKYIPRFVRVVPESNAHAAPRMPATAKAASAEPAGLTQPHEPRETALSAVAHREVATRIGAGAMEAARYEATAAWRRRLAIFWLSIGWVLGALTISTAFLVTYWARSARATTSMQPAPAPAPASHAIAAEPGTSYEAEAPGNTFHQAVRSWPCDWCSGGARVRYIGRSPRNYLVINNISVARPDSYEMVIFYLVDGTRTLFLSVNDGPVTKLLLSGKGWREVAKVSVTVRLTAGNNKVKFYNDSGYAPDIDRIVIR